MFADLRCQSRRDRSGVIGAAWGNDSLDGGADSDTLAGDADSNSLIGSPDEIDESFTIDLDSLRSAFTGDLEQGRSSGETDSTALFDKPAAAAIPKLPQSL